MMLIIQHADAEALDKDLWEAEKARLLQVFMGPSGIAALEPGQRGLPGPSSSEGVAADYADDEARTDPYRVTSLYLQLYVGLSAPTPDHPFQLLAYSPLRSHLDAVLRTPAK